VDIIGLSKGHGYMGCIKRHHFRRGRETHGNKQHRDPGSVGNHTYPAKVFKGKKMAGHMGFTRITVKNLKVMNMVTEKNLLVVIGSVPGPNNAVLDVRKAN
jgi:large subunit ribosomal protein L3